MSSNEMSKGIGERVVYGAVVFATAKLVDKQYMTADMQAYVAAGAVTFIGGFYGWWQNRPGRLLDRAAMQVPESSKLVITTKLDAPKQDIDAAHDLAKSAGEKVTAKVQI